MTLKFVILLLISYAVGGAWSAVPLGGNTEKGRQLFASDFRMYTDIVNRCMYMYNTYMYALYSVYTIT